MTPRNWDQRWERIRGRGPIVSDISYYAKIATQIDRAGEPLRGKTDAELRQAVATIRDRLHGGIILSDLLADTFAVTREIAARTVGLRAFPCQLSAGVALHEGKLVEMKTGEGKTLAAVFPAVLRALAGSGVHILTFNDYLARRDTEWMRPVYEGLGLSVATIQEGTSPKQRRKAYEADVTYATAKEAGFDFLRDNTVRSIEDRVHRPFNYAIVDEADSILIDEARVPLVLAGARETSEANPYRIAELIKTLKQSEHWERDENGRNVHLTEAGIDHLEDALDCDNLHGAENNLLLSEVNQALHAQVLLHRDVDYVVRDATIEIVDEFTGRVVADRRWPDGLQSALEAKEGLSIQPGGQILGSITLQHFLGLYSCLAGMTATAKPAAAELAEMYGLQVVPIPPNRPCIRDDQSPLVFTHREAKQRALVQDIAQANARGRPVLVGTGSVEESEILAGLLDKAGIECQVLNAKNDEREAEIIADAGAAKAVTISTNMAGRGTDVKLGGASEQHRDRVLGLGGLLVIGTNLHESSRIDNQLRGRAGRQGDPGSSRFYVSLEDSLMVRFGIDRLIPPRLRPVRQNRPLSHPTIIREVTRLQRIVEGQNKEIRSTLSKYTRLVEKQRKTLFEWRSAILEGTAEPIKIAGDDAKVRRSLEEKIGTGRLRHVEGLATLHHIDQGWAQHLAFVSDIREGIHLVGIGGLDPLHEFHKQIAAAFQTLHDAIKRNALETVASLVSTGEEGNEDALMAPSSTWTYLVNDRALTELQQLLFGHGSGAFSAGAVLMTWPLLLAWAVWRKITVRQTDDS